MQRRKLVDTGKFAQAYANDHLVVFMTPGAHASINHLEESVSYDPILSIPCALGKPLVSLERCLAIVGVVEVIQLLLIFVSMVQVLVDISILAPKRREGRLDIANALWWVEIHCCCCCCCFVWWW